MIQENVDVIKHLVVDRFKVEKLAALDDLEPDQGKVVNYEGDQLAIYKDAQGITHIFESKCTHLYCTLVWNRGEKSWDCPCHGSRFGIDGKVLTGPAVKGLSAPEESDTTYHFPFFQKLFEHAPLPIIHEGKLNLRNMRKELLTKEELMVHLRENGIEDISEVKKAFVEGDGNISFVKYEKSDRHPPKTNKEKPE